MDGNVNGAASRSMNLGIPYLTFELADLLRPGKWLLAWSTR
jgi:hypothetical protein